MDIVIDWAQVKNMDSLYDSLFEQLNSPSWHGRKLNALRDSVIGGDINGVEPPYKVMIKNESQIPGELADFSEGVKEVLIDANREIRGIEIVYQAA